jgi:hypothetical protein
MYVIDEGIYGRSAVVNLCIVCFSGAHQESNDAQKHIHVKVTLFVLQSMSGFHSLLDIKLSIFFHLAKCYNITTQYFAVMYSNFHELLSSPASL